MHHVVDAREQWLSLVQWYKTHSFELPGGHVKCRHCTAEPFSFGANKVTWTQPKPTWTRFGHHLEVCHVATLEIESHHTWAMRPLDGLSGFKRY